MKIVSLEAFNKHNSLKINKITFNDFTLLVGASGVGKTQILNAISQIKNIANGETVSGFCWKLGFIADGKFCNWSGEFEKTKNYHEHDVRYIPFVHDDEEKAAILNESLVVDGVDLIKRDSENIFYSGKEIVKLSPSESVIHLLRQEKDISFINKAFNNIVLINTDMDSSLILYRKSKDLDKISVSSLDDIREKELSLNTKLFLCQEKKPSYFSLIVDSYKDIFPFVEDVKIEKYEDETMPKAFNVYIIKVKERGLDGWVSHMSMSSGMLKTFIQIAYIHLSPKGTVFLIDEFENGFGVNCINDITDILLNSGNGSQFIITSHHPYIINNIPLECWKIISRTAGVVHSFVAKDLNLHESNHEAFTKLINLDIYANGADR